MSQRVAVVVEVRPEEAEEPGGLLAPLAASERGEPRAGGADDGTPRARRGGTHRRGRADDVDADAGADADADATTNTDADADADSDGNVTVSGDADAEVDADANTSVTVETSL